MSDPTRPVFNDRYEIQSRVGRGGMADVFKAHDRLLDRPVAIKVLFPEFASDPNFVERFRREAQSAANLTHPNVVGVFDWGQQGGTYFIVMEFVDGRSLADVLRVGGPLPAGRAADIAADVASALGFAHRNNVVHRDVKPANILVSDSGVVKVADFGIARAMNTRTEQDLTQAGAVMGTATYFSPEQAQGGQPDPRSDLYSLGIVMYEMVTGRPPFTGDNPVSIAYKQVHEMPVRPSQLNSAIPPQFETVIHRLLQKDPVKRYQSADELRMDLRRFREMQSRPETSDPVNAARNLPFDATTTVPAASVGATSAVPSVAPPTTIAQQRGQAAYSNTTQALPAQRVQPPVVHGGLPPVTYDEPPRRVGAIVAAVVATIVVLAAIFFALYKFLDNPSGGTAGQVQVASVVGETIEFATNALQSQGLKPVPEQATSDTIEAGKIISQSPPAGTEVDSGTEVKLIVSVGKEQVDLPKVDGTVATDAQKTLESLGFKVTITPQASDTVAAGTVISQNPPAGKVAPGASVALVVSSGKDKVIVPNVLNLDQVPAATQLTKLGLEPVVVNEASDSVKVGAVIRTDPAVNVAVDKGSTIQVIVSSGPAPVVVPNVVGLTETEATTALQAVGLRRTITLVNIADVSQAGKVVSQSPEGNNKNTLAAGQTVVLNVGKAPDPTTTTAPPSTTTTTTTPPTTTTTIAPTTTRPAGP
jgi:serine/threonine-protein kinase